MNLKSVLAALFIAAYFLALTKDAVHCYFTPDDCMNLYRSWIHPASELVRANIFFFLNSPFYRPMGSVWYRTIYQFAGFNPVPFHVANLCTLAANIWFTYCVSRRLSGSKAVGAVAAILIAYHGRFINLYFDTGYIYDVVCYFFYFAAFAYYLRVRARPRPPDWKEMTVLALLYICALNAKEIAATLPVFFAAYELLYHRPSIGTPAKLWRWLPADGRGVALAGLLAFAFVAVRFTTSTGLIAMGAFQPEFSLRRFMETSVNFVSPLFYRETLLPAAAVPAIWVALLAIALLTRSRTLQFAWLFIMLSPLPVAFINPRGPGQYYVVYFGWVLYASTLFVEAAALLFEKVPQAARLNTAFNTMLILSVGCAMFFVNRHYGWSDVDAVAQEGEELRVIVQQIHALRPVLRRGSRVLFLKDPIDEPWRIMYLVTLSYRDKDLAVDRVRYMNPPPTPRDIASYDYVFDYHHGRFYSSPQSWPAGPQPEIVYQYGYPAIYRSDWTRITPWTPARRGDRIIAMVKDLGATVPPVSDGKPFPTDPLAQVVQPVDVRIDGQPVEVTNKFGWPDRVGRYRVDFEIPQTVRSRQPQVTITAQGATGLPTSVILE